MPTFHEIVTSPDLSRKEKLLYRVGIPAATFAIFACEPAVASWAHGVSKAKDYGCATASVPRDGDAIDAAHQARNALQLPTSDGRLQSKLTYAAQNAQATYYEATGISIVEPGQEVETCFKVTPLGNWAVHSTILKPSTPQS